MEHRWIPTTESLPDNEKEVVISVVEYCNDFCQTINFHKLVAWYNIELKKWFYNTISLSYAVPVHNDVTHWTPLPSDPITDNIF